MGRFFKLLLFVVLVASVNLVSAQRIVLNEHQIQRKIIAEKLSGAIQIQTVSSVNDADYNKEGFLNLHLYLAEAFPLVQKKLRKEVINEYSLLYTWQGTKSALKPLLLSAHMDVVPVEEASGGEWQEKPYHGSIKDGYVWGRGTLDDKYRVIAILQAVERLLSEGYQPERTIYLAFGHDEEIGGENGAGKISEVLEKRNIKLEAVFDEGLAVVEDVIPGVKQQLALVGTAAKGTLNFKLTVKGEGGHSSAPPKDSPIEILSRAIIRLQENPFKSRMTTTTLETVEAMAEIMGGKQQFAVRHYWLFKGKILKMLAQDQATDALIRTKMTPTILQAGQKDNVMPRVASATFNVRILNGEDDKSVMRHIRKAISDDRVQVEMYGDYTPPSPVTVTNTWIYGALQNSIKDVFPKARVVPALFPGGTDAKHYTNLTTNIFRFAPQVVNREIAQLVHNVNERIAIDVFATCIQFYEVLIQNTCGVDPDTLLADTDLDDLFEPEDTEG
ncbi:carboxypeptidase PM20D1 [Pontibacter aydingkolensis]|uniref:M20/M25/M40 family metallo-hydrolase n=1 Tax=Pontibacter aydingkolensis TaxID=1911536 RepID=A0ABS7CXL8_9BACT|nr:M20/M25/M40 family metallo-hydrolase [Pontibacter aydingkolensis]MBW7468557.1 M20/M25/M40 family metallo-hydrolase [Pontibacter aydingkolensis]